MLVRQPHGRVDCSKRVGVAGKAPTTPGGDEPGMPAVPYAASEICVPWPANGARSSA